MGVGGDYHVKFHKQSSEIIREKIHDHIALLSVFGQKPRKRDMFIVQGRVKDPRSVNIDGALYL